MKSINVNNIVWSRTLLRAGLAAVFLYAAVGSLRQPANWSAYLPSFITSMFQADAMVKLFAVYELVLVVWIISGKYLKVAAALCALTLGGIVVVNPQQLIITFRDIGLFFMASALVFLPTERK